MSNDTRRLASQVEECLDFAFDNVKLAHMHAAKVGDKELLAKTAAALSATEAAHNYVSLRLGITKGGC